MNQQLLANYEAGPDVVEQALLGVPEHVLSVSPGPEMWSIHEIVIHLCDSEIVGADRFRRALADEDAQAPAYDESAWGDRLHYAARNAEMALNLFRLLRLSTVDLLNQLTPEQWNRATTHSQRGPLSITDLLKTYVGHVEYHLNQIQAIKTANGIQIPGSH